MNEDKQILEEKLKSGFSLSISQVLSDAVRAFGMGAGSYIGLMFILAILTLSFGFAFLISFEVLIIMGIAAAVLVVPVVQVGIARFAKKQLEGQTASFADFLSGTKFNYGQLILQAVVVGVITTSVSVLPDLNYYTDYFSMMRMGLEDPENFMDLLLEFNEAHANRGVLSFFVGIFSFYISLGLSLTPYIVSFYQVNAFTAMDISFRTINKVVFRAAVLNIVLSIIAGMGFVFLLIGGLATVPIYLIGSYLIFRYTIGEKDMLNRSSEGIEEHLID